MDIKKLSILLLFYVFIGCKSSAQVKNDPIEDLPSKIVTKYGIDIVPNQEIALKIAQIILQERFQNTKFEDLKPFTINLIAEGKVWDIIVIEKVFKNKITTYHVRINKNTSEILNLWVER
jgi:hypothetical protein